MGTTIKRASLSKILSINGDSSSFQKHLQTSSSLLQIMHALQPDKSSLYKSTYSTSAPTDPFFWDLHLLLLFSFWQLRTYFKCLFQIIWKLQNPLLFLGFLWKAGHVELGIITDLYCIANGICYNLTV